MSKIDLLQPRVRVIADYPFSPHKIGDIITGERFVLSVTTNWEDDVNVPTEHMCRIEDAGKYPALFTQCLWWEERKVEEMPEYVSYISLSRKTKIYGDAKESEDDFFKARVYSKVESWDEFPFGSGWFMNGNRFNSLCLSHLPATKEEYQAHQSK